MKFYVLFILRAEVEEEGEDPEEELLALAVIVVMFKWVQKQGVFWVD